MSTRFPIANLPENMGDYQRALENSLSVSDNAQVNTQSILSGLQQSVASNYGLGGRLTESAGTLDGKVVTRIGNYLGTISSTVTLQRSWNNLGNTLTLTTPNFVSNVAITVAGTADYSITGGSSGAVYYNWHRVVLNGAVNASRMLPYRNFAQTLVQASEVPANSNITLQMQTWGYIRNTNGTFVNGTLASGTIVRLLATLRAIALV